MKKKQFISKTANSEVEEKIIMHFRNFHCDTRIAARRGDKRNYGYWRVKLIEVNYEDTFRMGKNDFFTHSIQDSPSNGYKGDNYDTIVYVGDYTFFSVTKVDGCVISGRDPAKNSFDIELLDLTYMFENTKLIFENIPRIKVLRMRASQREKMDENVRSGIWKFPSNIGRIEVI